MGKGRKLSPWRSKPVEKRTRDARDASTHRLGRGGGKEKMGNQQREGGRRQVNQEGVKVGIPC